MRFRPFETGMKKNLKTKAPRGTFINGTSKHLVLFGKTRKMEGCIGGAGDWW